MSASNHALGENKKITKKPEELTGRMDSGSIRSGLALNTASYMKSEMNFDADVSYWTNTTFADDNFQEIADVLKSIGNKLSHLEDKHSSLQQYINNTEFGPIDNEMISKIREIYDRTISDMKEAMTNAIEHLNNEIRADYAYKGSLDKCVTNIQNTLDKL